MEFEVSEFTKVSVGGQIQVYFDNESSVLNGETTFYVKIDSDSEQRTAINVTSEGGTLTITADENEIVLTDGVKIYLSSLDLTEIRLESDQVAEFYGMFNQDELSVVTEANSKLYLYDTQVKNLTCRTEGESEFVLTTYSENLDGDQTYEEARGVQISETSLLVDNSFIVTGESVVLENGTWTVTSEVSSQYQMTHCDFITQGNTNIDAQGAACKNVNIKLEGSSEAKVWAFENITGKGEGESRLFYTIVEGLNINGFATSGNAQIIPLP